MNHSSLNMDCFADGQIGSKIWLCEEIEKLESRSAKRPVIWIFGGWYGIAAFLLFSRGRIKPESVRSFDIDPEATRIANLVNRTWERNSPCFKALTLDCGLSQLWSGDFGPAPDWVINTACEHFFDQSWWQRIPAGTRVALQSTDQPHEGEQVRLTGSVAQMKEQYSPLREIHFEGTMELPYREKWYRRFMLIGTKG